MVSATTSVQSLHRRGRLWKASAFWQRYKRNKAAIFGLSLITFFSIVSIFAPYIAHKDPFNMEFASTYISPNFNFPMGTDDLGRDVFSRVVWGARVSLFIGLAAALSSVVISVLIGSVAGYFGGKIDALLMRLTDMFLVIPTFFLVLLIVAMFGRGIWLIIFAIAVTNWPNPTRLLRAEFLSFRERQFVQAAKSIGASRFQIIFREILPNAIFPVIVYFGYLVAGAILTESSISFLGLGDPNTISWGWLLNDALRAFTRAWWLAAFPGIAIALTVISFNLIGDGLNDALNPKLRRR